MGAIATIGAPYDLVTTATMVTVATTGAIVTVGVFATIVAIP